MTSTLATVLFVCTGNICRSPYLERRFRAALAVHAVDGIVAASAGTHALVGHPISKPLAARLTSSGVDATSHGARQLTTADVRQAGLILTATRDHRRLIARMDEDVAARTFTVRQFVRLLRAAPDSTASLEALIDAANGARGQAGASTSDDDIEDPWRRSRRVYARVAQSMDEVVDELVDHLIP